ncbi:hypothetical protein V6N13_104978 [Hibiscus sabdariffa]|uniref:Uncharacterized protein n=2 Tax=Hibiscus sabdariffa TaxID=183260 RepID=A0ABR2A528_9ROSI
MYPTWLNLEEERETGRRQCHDACMIVSGVGTSLADWVFSFPTGRAVPCTRSDSLLEDSYTRYSGDKLKGPVIALSIKDTYRIRVQWGEAESIQLIDRDRTGFVLFG